MKKIKTYFRLFGESVLVTEDNKFKVAEWISEHDGYEAFPAVGQPFIQIQFNEVDHNTAKVGMYVSVTDFDGIPIITAQTAVQWQHDFGFIDK